MFSYVLTFSFSKCEAVNIISTYLSIFNSFVHSMMLAYIKSSILDGACIHMSGSYRSTYGARHIYEPGPVPLTCGPAGCSVQLFAIVNSACCHTSAAEMWDCVKYILIPPAARLPAQHGPGRYNGPRAARDLLQPRARVEEAGTGARHGLRVGRRCRRPALGGSGPGKWVGKAAAGSADCVSVVLRRRASR